MAPRSPKTKAAPELLPATGKTLAEVRPPLGPAWIIEGEDPETYERLLEQVARAIGPQDIVEWLLIKDIVALTWEIQRARNLSASLIALYRREAMEAILGQLLPKPDLPMLGRLNADLAAQWVDGQKAAEAKVDALFEKAGFSLAEVDAQALTEHAEAFDRLDARTARCEERRDNLLQQIQRRRAGAAKSVLDASEGVIEAEFEGRRPRARAQTAGAQHDERAATSR